MLELLRIVTPVLVSFIITVISMPFVIQYFSKKQLGQVTREEGPTWHESKSGTPTMGGVSFIFAVTITVLILSYFLDVFTTGILLLTFILILYGLIGFLDDYIKVIMKRNLGLTSLQKLIGQIIGGVVFYIGLNLLNYPTVLSIPFLGSINLGWGYGLFLLFWLVGFSNATNLTDGIDGLMASTGMIAYLAYGVIAGIQDQWDIMVFSLSVFGGLLGFFIFNKKPAKVFMGDVGSLALGAGLAGISILLNQEWTLILIGIIFVCETVSVMLQVSSFKLRGKRIFKMSPIHHHYEMVGWSEWKIVGIFSLIGFLMALVVLFILV